jgi:hypothetical protein
VSLPPVKCSAQAVDRPAQPGSYKGDDQLPIRRIAASNCAPDAPQVVVARMQHAVGRNNRRALRRMKAPSGAMRLRLIAPYALRDDRPA